MSRATASPAVVEEFNQYAVESVSFSLTQKGSAPASASNTASQTIATSCGRRSDR